jgi:hypothetical protein
MGMPEMENATIAVILAGLALLLNVSQRFFGGGWHLKSHLADVETRLKAAIEASEKGIEEQQRTAVHDFGETVSALKEHVRQVEFHLRDNYIRKDDFIVHMKAHDDLLRLNFANITQRLERIEKTLDEKT